YLNLDTLKAEQMRLKTWVDNHYAEAVLGFAFTYVVFAALSLPAAGLLSLLAGALFNYPLACAVVVVSATVGGTLAFLSTRYLFRDSVQSKFAQQLQGINAGMEKEGAFYLFGLRLVPVMPFFLINTLMGLTPIKTRTFFWVSLLGMIPGTLVFVNAGKALAQIESLKGILSPDLIVAFCLLAILPWVLKKLLSRLSALRS
ncbi:MAG: hypothetical protein RLZZ502_1733, partial [Pseudomonadota bacterium]